MAVWKFTSSDFRKQSEKTLQKHFTYTQFQNCWGFSVVLGTQKSITNLYRPDNHYSLPGVGKDGTVSDLLVFLNGTSSWIQIYNYFQHLLCLFWIDFMQRKKIVTVFKLWMKVFSVSSCFGVCVLNFGLLLKRSNFMSCSSHCFKLFLPCSLYHFT